MPWMGVVVPSGRCRRPFGSVSSSLQVGVVVPQGGVVVPQGGVVVPSGRCRRPFREVSSSE
jgi:hypothetical protein